MGKDFGDGVLPNFSGHGYLPTNDYPPIATFSWTDVMLPTPVLLEDVTTSRRPGWTRANKDGVAAIIMFIAESSLMSQHWTADMRTYGGASGNILWAPNLTTHQVDGHTHTSIGANVS